MRPEDSAETQAELASRYIRDVFEKMADASWGIAKGEDAGVPADESHSFTTQMAALYRPDGVGVYWSFIILILMNLSVLLTKQGSEVTENFKPYTTKLKHRTLFGAPSPAMKFPERMRCFSVFIKSWRFNLMLKWDGVFGTSAPKGADVTFAQNQHDDSSLAMDCHLDSNRNRFHRWQCSRHCRGGAGSDIMACIRPIVTSKSASPLCRDFVGGLFGAIQAYRSGSYLIFGLIWFIGAFTKIPLTARYSASG